MNRKPVSINFASASVLETLPRIGPKRAQTIIAARQYEYITDPFKLSEYLGFDLTESFIALLDFSVPEGAYSNVPTGQSDKYVDEEGGLEDESENESSVRTSLHSQTGAHAPTRGPPSAHSSVRTAHANIHIPSRGPSRECRSVRTPHSQAQPSTRRLPEARSPARMISPPSFLCMPSRAPEPRAARPKEYPSYDLKQEERILEDAKHLMQRHDHMIKDLPRAPTREEKEAALDQELEARLVQLRNSLTFKSIEHKGKPQSQQRDGPARESVRPSRLPHNHNRQHSSVSRDHVKHSVKKEVRESVRLPDRKPDHKPAKGFNYHSPARESVRQTGRFYDRSESNRHHTSHKSKHSSPTVRTGIKSARAKTDSVRTVKSSRSHKHTRRHYSSDSDSEYSSTSSAYSYGRDDSRSPSRSSSTSASSSVYSRYGRQRRDRSLSYGRSPSYKRQESTVRKSKPKKTSKHSRQRDRSHSRDSSSFYYDDNQSDEFVSEDDYGHKRHRHGDPNKHPKNLKYDGKGNWLSFKQKFDSYRRVCGWNDEECRDYLNWSLEGKAADFFTITTQMGQNYSFKTIMRKLESRFGAKELPETSRAKFQQAIQRQEESLDDWADRVLTLATPAFRQLPEKHGRMEAIAKFCQGCSDKEAGKQACFKRPRSMQEAVDLVRHFQYITQAVEKRPVRPRQEPTVNVVSSDNSRLDELEAAMKKLASQIEESLKTKEKGQVERKKIVCFYCNKPGHMKRDCFALKKAEAQKTLNQQGQTVEATPQSPSK